MRTGVMFSLPVYKLCLGTLRSRQHPLEPGMMYMGLYVYPPTTSVAQRLGIYMWESLP